MEQFDYNKIKMKLDEDKFILEEIRGKLNEMGSDFKLLAYLTTVGVENPKLCKNCWGTGRIGFKDKQPILCLCVIRQIRNRKVAYLDFKEATDEGEQKDEDNKA